ncbi:MAG: DUF4870 domain-containing protein [Desulfuromonadales bacterium]|nr:DUF4870 domain-containing protein [Desulfuromonadales bacterium]
MTEKPYEPTILPPEPPAPTAAEERSWAMACHLAGFLFYFFPFGHIFGPLAIWLLRGEKYPLVNDQGKEVLNFQISVTLYLVVSAILALAVIGFVLMGLLALFHSIVMIVAAVRAKGGERYRYPLTIRFIK